jgi:tetratricopeptide (TPR) repeat protein
MPQVLRQVFLSSTAADMQFHRDAVKAAIDRMSGWRCVGMEDFEAADCAPLQACLDKLAHCDVYVGLIGHCYGSSPPYSDKSFTRHEYEAAVTRKIPRLIFLTDEKFSVPADVWMKENNLANIEKQSAFRLQLANDRKAVMFNEDPAALAVRVTQAIREWERKNPLHDELSSPAQFSTEATAVPAQLRPDLEDFTGREAEVSRIVTKLTTAGGGTVAITALQGMGGVGKTALAMHVGRLVKAYYPDGQVLVDMQGQSPRPLDLRATLTKAARAFKPHAPEPKDEDEAEWLYREALRGKRVLVVLDNAPGGAVLRRATPPAGCGLIVTSRERVTLHDNALHEPLDMLNEPEAVELLRAAAQGRAEIGDGEWRDIAKACGYLPLALRVAGGYLAESPNVSAAEYLADLQKRRPESLQLGVDRDRDVWGALRLSVERLADKDPGLAAHWRLLAAFPGDFDRDAAAAVWDCDADTTRHDLSHLLRRALLLWDKDKARYRQQDLFRVIAAEEATEADLHVACLRHARYFSSVLEKAWDTYLEGYEKTLEGLALLDREMVNIRGAMEWAMRWAEHDRDALRVTCDLPVYKTYFLALRVELEELISWLQAGLAAAQKRRLGPEEWEFLTDLAENFRDNGDYAKGLEHAELSLKKARKLKSSHSEAASNRIVASILVDKKVDKGVDKLAITYLHKALPIFRRSGRQAHISVALNDLGRAHKALDRYDLALKCFQDALATDLKTGDKQNEGIAFYNIADVHADLGDYQKAVEYGEKASAIFTLLGAPNAKQAESALAKWREALKNAPPPPDRDDNSC